MTDVNVAPDPKPSSSYHWISLLILGGLALWVFFGQDSFVRLRFQELTSTSILEVLAPLLMVALFLERAVEVFISVAREAGKKEIQDRVDSAQQAVAESKGQAKAEATALLHEVEGQLAGYKRRTKTRAFYAGLIGGSLIAVSGVRCLWPLVEKSSLIQDSTQYSLFNLVDVALTAGLLAGGSEGLHQVIALLTDKIKDSRARVGG